MNTQREIIFRGRRKDTGEWVEGNYYHNIGKGDYHLIMTKVTNENHDVYRDSLQMKMGERTGRMFDYESARVRTCMKTQEELQQYQLDLIKAQSMRILLSNPTVKTVMMVEGLNLPIINPTRLLAVIDAEIVDLETFIKRHSRVLELAQGVFTPRSV